MRRSLLRPLPMLFFLAAALILARASATAADRSGVPSFPGARGLPTPAGVGSGQPRLAPTGDGAVLLSWLETTSPPRGRVDPKAPPPKSHALRVASLRGSKWSPVLDVAKGDSFFVNGADFPAVAAYGAHGLALAWLWKNGRGEYGYDARVSVSEDGGGDWTEPIALHRDQEGSEHGFLSLVPQGDGVRAVWLDGHNLKDGVEEGMADMTLHTRFLSPSGTPGREQELDDRTCDCCQTAAVAVGDEFLVAYRDRSPEEIRDIAVTRLDGGRWSAPVRVHEDGWKMAGCPVNGPALAARGKTVVVAWYTAANDSPRVKVAFSSDGGRRFGEPIRVDDGRPMGRVGVALLDDGTAAVSWVEADARETRLRARFVREGERPGNAATVARLRTMRLGSFPQMVRDGDRLVFAWTEPGTPTRVRLAAAKLPSPKR